MDFAFYRNFITVAETGNLSAAAKRLGIVQPALSAQMKAIERNYGVQLFKMQRGKRHIELTEAGETFLQQARQLCNTEDDISLRMQAFGRRAAGTLRFSVSHVRTDYFLRSYLIPFAKENPGISYQFHDATVEQQQLLLEAGSIDFAFANAPLPAAHDFATIKVQRESFYAFYNTRFAVPWAGKSLLSPEDLAGVPLCCNYGSCALTFATSGLGVAVVAALEGDAVPQGMVRRQLVDEKLHFDQTLYWSKEHKLSPAAEGFLEFFRKRI